MENITVLKVIENYDWVGIVWKEYFIYLQESTAIRIK